MLYTRRLVLEPLRSEHARGLFDGMRDPEITRYTPHDPPGSLAELEATFGLRASHVNRPDDEWHNWTPVLRDGGDPIGNVQITTFPGGDATLGYFVLRRWWRRGFAREACSAVIEWARATLSSQTLVAEIDVRNDASVALVRSLGFSLVSVSSIRDRKGTSDEARYALALKAPA